MLYDPFLPVPAGTGPVAILSQYARSVFIGLFTDDFTSCPPPQVGAFTEPPFPGYTRAHLAGAERPPLAAQVPGVAVTGTAAFTTGGLSAPVMVSGWLAGVPLAGGGEGLLAWGRFAVPVSLQPGATLLLPVTLTAAAGAVAGASDVLSAIVNVAISLGGRGMYVFRGEERALLKTTLRALNKIVLRDAAVPSLPKKTVKSDVVILNEASVPGINAGFALLLGRISTLLALTD